MSNRAVSIDCNPAAGSLSDRLQNPGPGFIGWAGVVGQNGTAGTTCGSRANPSGLGTFSTGGVALKNGFRNYVNTAQAVLRPETAMNYTLTAEFAPTEFLKGLDIQMTWYQVKISNALNQFGNPSNAQVNNPALGFSYIVPTDIAKAGVDVAGCSNNNTPSKCPEFEAMVAGLLNDPQNAVPPGSLTSILWINDGAIGNFGWVKQQGIDFSASYDFDAGDLGAFNVGITGTYYLHVDTVRVPGAPGSGGAVVDGYHDDLPALNGYAQLGVVTPRPRARYRTRIGWSNAKWDATVFMNYDGHYYHTQKMPRQFPVPTAGGTISGHIPCLINNYTESSRLNNIDISLGYTT